MYGGFKRKRFARKGPIKASASRRKGRGYVRGGRGRFAYRRTGRASYSGRAAYAARGRVYRSALLSRHRRVAFKKPGNVSIAKNAFKNSQVIQYTNLNAAATGVVLKGAAGLKFLDIHTASGPLDMATYGAIAAGVSNISKLAAIRSVRQEITWKNLSTYKMFIRISKWRCRSTTPLKAGDSVYGSLGNLITNGYTSAQTPVGGVAVASTGVSSTLFQNPVLVRYFKCVKMYKPKCIMPYETFKASQTVNRIRPGIVDSITNANNNFILASCKMSGITTSLMVAELWGDIVNDQVAFGTGAHIVHSPVLFATFNQFSAEIASINYQPQVYNAGQSAEFAATSLFVGDPSNLNQAPWVAQSSVTGGINTSGL